MRKPAYYNESNKHSAQWLRNLIASGHIPAGTVDERSIEDVTPNDLRGFSQHHFFAGIGIWPLALRLAGWGDVCDLWTASCPCQPFSEAGPGTGFADERHLWPALYYLIGVCRPARILGEQVASHGAGAWIDLVQDDMEAMDYAVGAVPFPAAGVRSFHRRERTYWAAHSRQFRGGRQAAAANHREPKVFGSADRTSGHSRVVDLAGPVADWLACADGRSRPIEPGLCAVVDEYPGRVERLRAFGNALDTRQARAFIEAVMEAA